MSDGIFRESVFNTIVATQDNWRNYAFFYKDNIITPEETLNADFEAVLLWCSDNFGEKQGLTPPHRWLGAVSSRCIYIREATDAVAFKLRWC